MDPVTGLSLGRIAIGTGALIDPDATARLFGLDPETNPQLRAMSRMFGAREVALGAVTLVARGRLRRNLVLVGIAVDGADALTGALELGEDAVPRSAAGVLSAVALGAVGSGVASLARGRRAAKAAAAAESGRAAKAARKARKAAKAAKAVKVAKAA